MRGFWSRYSVDAEALEGPIARFRFNVTANRGRQNGIHASSCDQGLVSAEKTKYMNSEKDKVESHKDLRGAGTTPSGYDGENPSTAGPGDTSVTGSTPETKEGKINPSAPNDANMT